MGAVVVASAVASTTLVVTEEPVAAADRRPNIVLITADDMSLTDLRWMPATRKLIRGAGANVPQFISNHPLCCPARAEILTGQYAQNNGVHHNKGPFGGYAALRQPDQHIGRWLRDAGYKTGFVGKFVNQWETAPSTQPGWTRFNPISRGVYRAFDLTLWHHGKPRRHTGTHTSDPVGLYTRRYIRSFSRTGAPFFVWASQVAPHGMQTAKGTWVRPIPATRHRSIYPNAHPPSLSDPAYGEADVSDKPQYVQDAKTMPRLEVRRWHLARIRSLKSVDDQVRAIVDTLRDMRELSNTYIVFTSDNGYMLGEHRLRTKNQPYEETMRVPMVVRGPGIPAGSTRPQLFSLVDLAPTFLDVARASAPGVVVDGRSMLPALKRNEPGYSHYLIQAATGEMPWWWRGVKSRDFIYTSYQDGFEELYDMKRDPHQLVNVAQDPAYADRLVEYRARLLALQECKGETCRNGGQPPGPPVVD